MSNRALVLDANILIRAVLGVRVRRILENYADRVSFFALNWPCPKRGNTWPNLSSGAAGIRQRRFASWMQSSVWSIRSVLTSTVNMGRKRKRRIGSRDPDAWPILASALALGCPIWTEDTDFFGCGVATWTSSSVEVFLSD